MNLISLKFTLFFILAALGVSNISGQVNFKMENIRMSGTVDTAFILEGIRMAKKIGATDADSAIFILEEARRQSMRISYPYGTGLAFLRQGVIYMNSGLYEESRSALEAALPYFEMDAVGRREIPSVFNNLGNVFFIKADYENALNYYYKSIHFAEQNVPDLNIDYIYANLASVLSKLGRDPLSTMPYLNKAEAMARGDGNFSILSKVYNNKGLAFFVHQHWDSSLYFFRKALDLSRQHHLRDVMHLCLSNIGVVYLEQNETDSALFYLLQAQELGGNIPAMQKNRALSALGNAYRQAGQYQKAATILQEQYSQAVAMDQKDNIMEAHYNLAQLYGATKEYFKAYDHAWNYILLNNRFGGAEVVKNVNNLEVRYRTAEKEKDLIQAQLVIAEQEKNLERKNKWMAIIIAGIIIFVLVLFLIRKSYLAKQKLVAQKLKSMEQNRAIESMKATMKGEETERIRIARELHDGIGGLISAAKMNVAALGKENYSADKRAIFETTSQILDEVSAELRMTARNMMPHTLQNQNLIEAISSFCNYIRQSRKLKIEVQTYGAFDTLPEDYQLAIYRIVQELVHNIVKHAKATQVLVQLMFQFQVMSITVEDNGIGIDMDKLKDKDSVGLESIKARINSMSGTFNLDTAKGKGTSVYIEFEVAGEPQNVKEKK